MPGGSTRTFDGSAAAPAQARRFVKSTVLGTRPLTDTFLADLELVVSELVTNSVRAGSASIVVTVAVDEECVRIDVADESRGWPEQRAAGSRDTTGRGLALVSAISAQWGVRMAADGKAVWASLAF